MRDYEELVVRLRSVKDTWQTEDEQWMLDAADAIEELVSNADKFKWISVEERLPAEAGEYMVAYHPCCWDIVHFNVTMVGLDSFRGKTTWAKKKYQRVTHWMPLPKPPKEVTDK